MAATSGGGSTTGDAEPDVDLTTGGGPSEEPGTTGGSSTTTDETTTAVGDGTTGDGAAEETWTPTGCPAIYAQNLLPTFELEIAPDELAALEQEWLDADDDVIVEHPLASFKFEDTVITDASVRLRGNDSHWAGQGKMQLEVSFNTYHKKGRFMGLKHVLFDAAAYNRSFLRDRLALAIMRDVGLAAPCANNARVVINGEYYGLFTNIEKIDGEFLERHFEHPDGNLYKRGGSTGWEKKTHEDDPDISDLAGLEGVTNIDELLAVMNLEQALLEWATEAVIPDRDGLWAGGLNGYVYNDPETGFVVLPWDLDDSFTRLTPDIDPVTYKKPPEVYWGRPFYEIALADPVWFQRYIDTIEYVLNTGYRVEVLQKRIDDWSAQIAAAAAEDPNKPFTTEQHLAQVKKKREFVAARAEFLAGWLLCWKNGGTDGDGDGVCESA